jgi:hypothetical protein
LTRWRLCNDPAGFTGRLLACALIEVLHERGWRIDALPGEPTRLTRDGASIEPFARLHACTHSKSPLDAWRQLIRETDLATADFAATYERCRRHTAARNDARHDARNDARNAPGLAMQP